MYLKVYPFLGRDTLLVGILWKVKKDPKISEILFDKEGNIHGIDKQSTLKYGI